MGFWAQFTGNTAFSGGGGIATILGVHLTITGSLFSGNQVTDTFAQGGGIRSAGTLAITQTTFSQNSGSRGGAIFVADGTADFTQSTFTGNWGPYGGGFCQEGGVLNLTNVAFANNGYAPNGSEVTTAGGAMSWGAGNATLTNSLSSDSSCGFGLGHDNVNLLISPLGYHGGFSQTIMLGKGSPAIDAGTGTGCPSADQRGVARPQGAACDVGAVEDTPAEAMFNQFLKVFLPTVHR